MKYTKADRISACHVINRANKVLSHYDKVGAIFLEKRDHSECVAALRRKEEERF